MKLKDMTIAEYAHIRVRLMNRYLGAMLTMDAIAITLTVVILDAHAQELKMPAVTLLVFACATGVALYFLAKRYIDSVNYRFAIIEDVHMEAIAKVAKRFFFPFMICFTANIVLAAAGSLVLLLLTFSVAL
jgi:hypothetical protein